MFKILISISLLTCVLFGDINSELQKKYNMGDNNSGYQLAMNYYKKHKYLKAEEIFKDLMIAGYPKSFKMLGIYFEKGFAGVTNCHKAVMFYIGGGTAGDCSAYKELERMSRTGSCLNSPHLKIANQFHTKYIHCKGEKNE